MITLKPSDKKPEAHPLWIGLHTTVSMTSALVTCEKSQSFISISYDQSPLYRVLATCKFGRPLYTVALRVNNSTNPSAIGVCTPLRCTSHTAVTASSSNNVR